MSSCMTLTSGICRGCRDNAGGIKKFYVADINDVQWPLTTDSDGAITDIVLDDDKDWYVLQPNKYSSNWQENINVSVENGTLGYEQVITAVFGKNDQAVRNTIAEMAKGDLIIIIVDNNDKMWLVGNQDNGAYVSGGNSASGTALTDLNGWNVTFTCQSREPADTVLPENGGYFAAALAEADSACS